MKLKKKLSVIMAALMVSSMFMSGCNNSKMANVDKNSREQKLEATMKNLKNRKEKITTDKAALMTTDYEDITGFKGVTLDGSEYSAKDLAKKDMTIAYVWYPSWHHCVESMPELGEFSKKIPENMSFITICDNSGVNDKVVKNIFDKANYHPVTLVDGDEKFQTVFDHLVYAPAILLIDKNGKIHGEMVLKGDNDKVENYTEFIKLAQMELEGK